MIWKIKWDEEARKELRKLDKFLQKEILLYFSKKINTEENPRRFGKPLLYDKHGLWRYRIQSIRVICQIQDHDLLVLVLRVGHRKNIYKR